uniref:Testican-1 n=1 Tax=Canis lupus familiaris TaxID=9615 RepID=A0A8P0TK85_CANLF
MPAIAVLAAAAAAWCFLQAESRHLDAPAGGAGPNNGNFLDNDQWLSTVSQYDRDKYWNRFRDVSTAAAGPCEGRGGGAGAGARTSPSRRSLLLPRARQEL